MGLCPSRRTESSKQVMLKGKSDDKLVHLIPCAGPTEPKPPSQAGRDQKQPPQARNKQRQDRVTVFQKKAANRERERQANLSPPQANGFLQQMKEGGNPLSFTFSEVNESTEQDSGTQYISTVEEKTKEIAMAKPETQVGDESEWESFLRLKTEQRKSSYALPMSNDGTFTSSYQQLLSSSPERKYEQKSHSIIFAPSA